MWAGGAAGELGDGGRWGSSCAYGYLVLTGKPHLGNSGGNQGCPLLNTGREGSRSLLLLSQCLQHCHQQSVTRASPLRTHMALPSQWEEANHTELNNKPHGRQGPSPWEAPSALFRYKWKKNQLSSSVTFDFGLKTELPWHWRWGSSLPPCRAAMLWEHRQPQGSGRAPGLVTVPAESHKATTQAGNCPEPGSLKWTRGSVPQTRPTEHEEGLASKLLLFCWPEWAQPWGPHTTPVSASGDVSFPPLSSARASSKQQRARRGEQWSRVWAQSWWGC